MAVRSFQSRRQLDSLRFELQALDELTQLGPYVRHRCIERRVWASLGLGEELDHPDQTVSSAQGKDEGGLHTIGHDGPVAVQMGCSCEIDLPNRLVRADHPAGETFPGAYGHAR